MSIWKKIRGVFHKEPPKTVKRMTQQKRILAWLKAGKPLTQLEATYNGLGTRLSSQIYALRRKGYNIRMERHPKGYGVYTMEGR